MAYSIRKEFEFDAAHRLSLVSKSSKCWNIHGHRYKVEVYIESEKLDSQFMVIDFFNLAFVKEWLDTHWDHGYILNSEDYSEIAHCEKHGYKHSLLIGTDPTAEAMSGALFQLIARKLSVTNVKVVKVVVHETPKCSAEYTPK